MNKGRRSGCTWRGVGTQVEGKLNPHSEGRVFTRKSWSVRAGPERVTVRGRPGLRRRRAGSGVPATGKHGGGAPQGKQHSGGGAGQDQAVWTVPSQQRAEAGCAHLPHASWSSFRFLKPFPDSSEAGSIGNLPREHCPAAPASPSPDTKGRGQRMLGGEGPAHDGGGP